LDRNASDVDSNVVTIAGVVLGIAVAILLFRLARELYMDEREETVWVAYAERVVVAAALLSTTVLVLAVFGVTSRPAAVLIPRAATLAGVVLLMGYVPAILAHYRFIGSAERSSTRDNPEPLERTIVHAVFAAAGLVAMLGFLL
jgi:hypothetical protein